MTNLNFSGPINPLSFGNVTVNMLRELHKKDIKVSFFPIGANLDFSVFDNLSKDFQDWVTDSYNKRFSTLKNSSPSFRMWHLNGSESRIGKNQTLYTFYECDDPTFSEKNICDIQDNCIFSSSHAKKCFDDMGCDNTYHIPIGFDTDFKKTDKKYLEGRIHFGLMGKFERRKNTGKIIRLWAEKYGNNNDYQLSCCVTNPFFKPEQMNQVIAQSLDGKRYTNINFIPFLKTNSEVNELLNAIDIDLTGLSGAEGWNLPAFNATCLGKWSIVLNNTSHKDWANESNSILVEPSEQQDIYDGAFFHKGAEFNQGSMSTFSKESFTSATESAINKCNTINTDGEKLKEQFTYEKTISNILKIVENES
jgi:hypothetical protein